MKVQESTTGAKRQNNFKNLEKFLKIIFKLKNITNFKYKLLRTLTFSIWNKLQQVCKLVPQTFVHRWHPLALNRLMWLKILIKTSKHLSHHNIIQMSLAILLHIKRLAVFFRSDVGLCVNVVAISFRLKSDIICVRVLWAFESHLKWVLGNFHKWCQVKINPPLPVWRQTWTTPLQFSHSKRLVKLSILEPPSSFSWPDRTSSRHHWWTCPEKNEELYFCCHFFQTEIRQEIKFESNFICFRIIFSISC